MKKIVIAIVVVAAVVLLLPPVVGSQAKTRLESGVDAWNLQTGSYAKFAVEDYDKGWFSSTAKVRFRLTEEFVASSPELKDNPDFAAAMQPFTEGTTQIIHITHGPVILGTNVGIGLGEVVSVWDGGTELAAVLEKTGNPYFVRSTVMLGLTGAGDITVDAPAFTLADVSEGVDQIVFAGADATGTVDTATNHVNMTGKINGFSVRGADGEAVIEGTSFDIDLSYPESAPYGLGTGKMNIERIVALSETDDPVSMDFSNASFGFNSVKDANGKVNVDVSYAIGAIKGPDLNLSDAHLTFGLGNLNADALTTIQKISAEAVPDPEDPLAVFNLYRDPLYDLLADGMTMHFDPIRFTYNDQSLSAKINVATKPANLPEKAAFTLDNPLIFLNLFAVNADMSIDKNLATEMAVPQLKSQLIEGMPEGAEVSDAELDDMARAQAPMMLGAMVGQGFIRDEGNNYAVTAAFDNGAVTVNGNPIPLGALMGGG